MELSKKRKYKNNKSGIAKLFYGNLVVSGTNFPFLLVGIGQQSIKNIGEHPQEINKPL